MNPDSYATIISEQVKNSSPYNNEQNGTKKNINSSPILENEEKEINKFERYLDELEKIDVKSDINLFKEKYEDLANLGRKFPKFKNDYLDDNGDIINGAGYLLFSICEDQEKLISELERKEYPFSYYLFSTLNHFIDYGHKLWRVTRTTSIKERILGLNEIVVKDKDIENFKEKIINEILKTRMRRFRHIFIFIEMIKQRLPFLYDFSDHEEYEKLLMVIKEFKGNILEGLKQGSLGKRKKIIIENFENYVKQNYIKIKHLEPFEDFNNSKFKKILGKLKEENIPEETKKVNDPQSIVLNDIKFGVINYGNKLIENYKKYLILTIEIFLYRYKYWEEKKYLEEEYLDAENLEKLELIKKECFSHRSK